MAAVWGGKSLMQLAWEDASVCVDRRRGRWRSYWLISFKLDLSHEGAGTPVCVRNDSCVWSPSSTNSNPERAETGRRKTVSSRATPAQSPSPPRCCLHLLLVNKLHTRYCKDLEVAARQSESHISITFSGRILPQVDRDFTEMSLGHLWLICLRLDVKYKLFSVFFCQSLPIKNMPTLKQCIRASISMVKLGGMFLGVKSFVILMLPFENLFKWSACLLDHQVKLMHIHGEVMRL